MSDPIPYTPDLSQEPPEPQPVECQCGECYKEFYPHSAPDAIEAWGAWFYNRECADLYYARMMDDNIKNGEWLHNEYVTRVLGR